MNKETFLKKVKFFGRKTKASYLMTATLLVQKIGYIYAVLLEKERFLYLLSVLRNMSYERGKNFRKFFCSLFCPKTPSMKKIDVISRPKCSLSNACTIYETMDPVFGLGSDI